VFRPVGATRRTFSVDRGCTLLIAVILTVPLGGGWTPAGCVAQAGAPRCANSHATVLASEPFPPYLSGASSAYDVADGFVLVFGGLTDALTPSSLSLEYRNGSWSALSGSAATPPGRWGASMVYDPVEREVVLFGGCTIAACGPTLSDTWTFSRGQWTDVTSSAGSPPAARGESYFAWCDLLGAAVLFGGEAGTTPFRDLNDTWTFSAGHWTNLTSNLTGPAPSARFGGGMTSLATLGPLLFGGVNATALLGDTWEFSSTPNSIGWTDVTALVGGAPSARRDPALAIDGNGGAILFGGYAAGAYDADLWAFTAQRWVSQPNNGGPPGTYGATASYDASDGYLLLFGGVTSGGVTNGAWTYHAGAWRLLNPAAPFNPVTPIVIGLLFAVFLAVVGAVGFSVRRRRDRALAAVFPPGVPSDIREIPTGSWSTTYRDPIVVGVVLALVFGLPVSIFLGALVLGARAGAPAGALAGLAAVVAVLLILVLALVGIAVRTVTRSIGVSTPGVVVRRGYGEMRVPWSCLEPSPLVGWKRLSFRVTYPGKHRPTNAFLATYDQARAIVDHPSAPRWTLSPGVANALGRPVAMVASATALPSGARPLPPPPPAGGGSGRPAQLRRCPKCGTLANLRARFCPNCGQPFPNL